MATLLELSVIETNSKQNHTSGANAAVDAAVELRGKVRMALRATARKLLNGQKIKSDTYPNDANELNEAIGWAQFVGNNIASATETAFGLALSGASGLSVANIFALSDADLLSGVEALVPAMAKGKHPSRQ